METGYTNQVDSQLSPSSAVVVKVEICDEDHENIQGSLSTDDTVRPVACLQSMEEPNGAKTM